MRKLILGSLLVVSFLSSQAQLVTFSAPVNDAGEWESLSFIEGSKRAEIFWAASDIVGLLTIPITSVKEIGDTKAFVFIINGIELFFVQDKTKNGVIAIYDSKTNKRLLDLTYDGLIFQRSAEKAPANASSGSPDLLLGLLKLFL